MHMCVRVALRALARFPPNAIVLAIPSHLVMCPHTCLHIYCKRQDSRRFKLRVYEDESPSVRLGKKYGLTNNKVLL